MSRYTFIFLMVILATVAGLIYAASKGSVTALVVLAVVLTILLISLGAVITLFTVRVMAHREQHAFRDNVAENLAMMKAMQTIQNQQNFALLRQVKALPAGNPELDFSQALEIDEGVFTQLEEQQ